MITHATMRKILLVSIALLFAATGFAQSNTYKTITALQADTLIKDHAVPDEMILLDVRTSGEYINERIEKSKNLDVNASWFNDSLDQLDKNRIYFVYCSSGSRSAVAFSRMQARNFRVVYNLQGGLAAWKAAGFPTIKGSASGIDPNIINALSVKIYPNPVVDLSTLAIEGFVDGEVRLEILNALGSQVLSQKMVPGRTITLNGRELSPGLYFYRLVLPENQVKSGRFQVAR
jgi:phage shock protein E